eukprot:scaffold1300_cov317-Prasinococcus_capsulatus_cf.AAC.9
MKTRTKRMGHTCKAVTAGISIQSRDGRSQSVPVASAARGVPCVRPQLSPPTLAATTPRACKALAHCSDARLVPCGKDRGGAGCSCASPDRHSMEGHAAERCGTVGRLHAASLRTGPLPAAPKEGAGKQATCRRGDAARRGAAQSKPRAVATAAPPHGPPGTAAAAGDEDAAAGDDDAAPALRGSSGLAGRRQDRRGGPQKRPFRRPQRPLWGPTGFAGARRGEP